MNMNIDEQYFSDFDTALLGDNIDFPKVIVDVDCQDGRMLCHAFERAEKKQTEIVALILDPTKLDEIRRQLADIPHRIALTPNTSPESLINALKTVGVDNSEKALFISRLGPILASSFGWIQMQPTDQTQLVGFSLKGLVFKSG